MTNDSSLQAPRITLPRHKEILRLLDNKGSLTISELTSALNVSEQTIRRDLKKLEEMNCITRFHGGANSLEPQKSQTEPTLANKNIDAREYMFVEEKEAIGHKVADIVPDGSTVFITIGTTVEKIAQVLNERRKDLLIITDSIRVAYLIFRPGRNKVLVPSGIISSPNGGISSLQSIGDLKHFRPDFTITSVGAIERDGTMLDFNLSEVEAAKVMMKNSKQTIIACDHTKFTAKASLALGDIRDVDYLISDEEPNEDIKRALTEGSVTFIKA